MGTSDIHSAAHSQFNVRSAHVSQPPLLVLLRSGERAKRKEAWRTGPTQ
jgi:hypothetical protein